MTKPELVWRRHLVPEIGLSFDVNSSWPLEMVELDDGAIVSQWLPNDGAVFVRYGADQTLDRFLAGLGDLLTAATTLADEPVSIAGRPARRLTVSLEPRRKQIPGPRTAGRNLIRVTGFSVRGVPVLVGYRLPDEGEGDIRAEVERIVDSVDLEEEPAADDGRASRPSAGGAGRG